MWPGFERERLSVVMTSAVARGLEHHLVRDDGQEDLCFVLWRPSLGHRRVTAIVGEALLPEDGERHVHGDVSFEGSYFLRCARKARDDGCGMGLIHTHPGGAGWQGLSPNDTAAESGHAGQAGVLTGLPLLGLTLGSGSMRSSARFWRRAGVGEFTPMWCESVRVAGDQFQVNFNPSMRPSPRANPRQVRTVSAWGPAIQNDLVRLRVGVVGAGSVGALVAESLARMGVIDITLIDYDAVEEKNLDRLLHATEDDARLGTLKVKSLRRGLLISSTASSPNIHALDASVVEPSAFAEALDLDVVFCCVDRPWARSVCNFLAYIHLIPVIDGGVSIVPGVNRMVGAEWRAHVVTAGRKCLECIGQYDPAGVQLERTGQLEETHYIEALADDDNPLPTGENVFAFAAAAAGAEVLQFVAMVVAPAGVRQVPPQLFHFTTGSVDLDRTPCRPNCLYSGPWLARGDSVDVVVTGMDHAAIAARARRQPGTHASALRLRSLRLRVAELLDRVAGALRSES
jgi:molybdopterin/thiamine biosynthesis adenylyltransferase